MNPDQLGDQLPRLDGEGLSLRGLTRADLPALLSLFSDEEVVRFMSVPLLRSEEDARQFLAEIHHGFQTGTLYQWGIEVDGALAGTCTLAALDRVHRRAELGFALGRPFRGRGVMGRAARVVIDFAFTRLDLRRVEADTDPRNEASIRVLERLGFQREGLQRERYLQLGEVQDAVVFGLLRREWEGRGGGSGERR